MINTIKNNKCKCECGQIVKQGNKFIHGHNYKFILLFKKRNKTYEKMYGKAKAKQLKKLLSKINSKNRFGENNPNFKGDRALYKQKVYCIDCNKKLSGPNVKRCKSCSNSKNNYVHGNGYLPYPIEFNSKLKEQIRKRDCYQCQNCSITEEEHIIVFGKRLSIRHIDYNKENNNKNNLITLCSSCNIRVNFNREYWRIYFYENYCIN